MTTPETGFAVVTDSLADQVYRLLRDQIVHGRHPQGERLDIPALAASMGVSKTPIREALVRLEADQLVVTRPRSGTFVARITAADIDEMCGMRKAIEWFATGEATLRMPERTKRRLKAELETADRAAARGDYEPFYRSDQNLHRSIVEHAGNARVVAVRDGIEAYLEWLRIGDTTDPAQVAVSAARHHEIVDAMLAGDAAAAREVAALHVDEVREQTLADFHAAHPES
ncbi:GntR family transcriptional regulator [Amycolatopsis jiangsuensis]|uniref:DNA-binding GntR family transcriptional regulator n=1 Tax=Amycolatopsis jiangsuensis TaxID=1181879 RepID=A0A840INI6_9PSEU|nr:GntR family transcriptional regulator [Amycolatopsis jiangsuensis]MBB4683510.1 DNA-binding GntR family transcriptional regulator [Amycolatopsis jiangsuensis]